MSGIAFTNCWNVVDRSRHVCIYCCEYYAYTSSDLEHGNWEMGSLMFRGRWEMDHWWMWLWLTSCCFECEILLKLDILWMVHSVLIDPQKSRYIYTYHTPLLLPLLFYTHYPVTTYTIIHNPTPIHPSLLTLPTSILSITIPSSSSSPPSSFPSYSSLVSFLLSLA